MEMFILPITAWMAYLVRTRVYTQNLKLNNNQHLYTVDQITQNTSRYIIGNHGLAETATPTYFSKVSLNRFLSLMIVSIYACETFVFFHTLYVIIKIGSILYIHVLIR